MSTDTLYNPEKFCESLPPWFDGFFDWEWIIQCFEGTKITPTDVDSLVERNYHYLIIETKKPNVTIPQGQLWALERLCKAKSFTIIRLWGKDKPQKWIGQVHYRSGCIMPAESGFGREAIVNYVKRWFTWANSQ